MCGLKIKEHQEKFTHPYYHRKLLVARSQTEWRRLRSNPMLLISTISSSSLLEKFSSPFGLYFYSLLRFSHRDKLSTLFHNVRYCFTTDTDLCCSHLSQNIFHFDGSINPYFLSCVSDSYCFTNLHSNNSIVFIFRWFKILGSKISPQPCKFLTVFNHFVKFRANFLLQTFHSRIKILRRFPCLFLIFSAHASWTNSRQHNFLQHRAFTDTLNHWADKHTQYEAAAIFISIFIRFLFFLLSFVSSLEVDYNPVCLKHIFLFYFGFLNILLFSYEAAFKGYASRAFNKHIFQI